MVLIFNTLLISIIRLAAFEREISLDCMDTPTQSFITDTGVGQSESSDEGEEPVVNKRTSVRFNISSASERASLRMDSIGAVKKEEWSEKPETNLSSIFIWTTLHPTGTAALYWSALICMVAMYNLIFIPIRVAFPYFEERYRGYWYFIDSLADLYYVTDILVLMRTSYMVEGCLEYNWRLIVMHYVKSTVFLFDVISVIPLDFLLIRSDGQLYHNYIIAVRLTRLLKFSKIYAFISRAESRSDRPNYIRLGSLVLILATLIHCNSCVYFVISTAYAYNINGEDDWVFQGIHKTVETIGRNISVIFPSKTFIDQYFHCLHWSTQMLTTIAEVNSPVSDLQFIYAILLLLFAVLMFATLVGNVGNIIINLNAARTRFESRLDNVKQYMHNRNIKESLQDNVLRWFDHLWERNRGIDEQETLQNLPTKLRARIAFKANEKVLINNDIYKLGDTGFKIDLVLKLRSELFPPMETIYHAGHIGNDMYIIRSGKVHLSKRANNRPKVVLADGDCFGENCVINFNEFGRKRTETAKTVGFCDILMLEKKDLIELLVDYPDVKEKLSERFYESVTKFTENQDCNYELDIADATEELNILIQKYNDLKEQTNVLINKHRDLLNAVKQLPTNP